MARAAHVLAIEFDDDVRALETGLLGRAIGTDLFNHDSGVFAVGDLHADFGAASGQHHQVARAPLGPIELLRDAPRIEGSALRVHRNRQYGRDRCNTRDFERFHRRFSLNTQSDERLFQKVG